MGDIFSAELVMHFSQWPRDWQADADWLRFRDQGGYTREVTSHYLYITETLPWPGQAALEQADLSGRPEALRDPCPCHAGLQRLSR